MDINKTIEILEALASGCSPTTGEMIENESILNERDVIRALQIAIDKLKTNKLKTISDVKIDETDIKSVIELFKEEEQNPTSNKLVGFFLGTRKFQSETFVSNQLYGKYRNLYQKGQLLDFFTRYLAENNLTNRNNEKNDPYKKIDFFQKETFNRLSEKAINQLKEKVDELGILKTENLSEYVQNARINHPRAYESWTDTEKELLSKAIEYTNDLDLLSDCFQRGKSSIESCGQKLIYESQNL
ncbi:MAG: hypothetical protein CSA42_02175 [Gammaproteobacteria bacterium]|nr:MAG: hypothetical protein CSA42_02175 [Gammaproteobacteria bacterium]